MGKQLNYIKYSGTILKTCMHISIGVFKWECFHSHNEMQLSHKFIKKKVKKITEKLHPFLTNEDL